MFNPEAKKDDTENKTSLIGSYLPFAPTIILARSTRQRGWSEAEFNREMRNLVVTLGAFFVELIGTVGVISQFNDHPIIAIGAYAAMKTGLAITAKNVK